MGREDDPERRLPLAAAASCTRRGCSCAATASAWSTSPRLKGIHYAIESGRLAAEAAFARAAARRDAGDRALVVRRRGPRQLHLERPARGARHAPGVRARLLRRRRARERDDRVEGPARRSGSCAAEPDAEQPLLAHRPRRELPGARRQAHVRQALVGLRSRATRRATTSRTTSASSAACRARSRDMWVHMCPAQVYEVGTEGGDGTVTVELAPSNCVQCGAITAKGGRLTPPEGGSGPRVHADVAHPIRPARALTLHGASLPSCASRAHSPERWEEVLARVGPRGERRLVRARRRARDRRSRPASAAARRRAARARSTSSPATASARSCSCCSPSASPRTRSGGSSRRCVPRGRARRRRGAKRAGYLGRARRSTSSLAFSDGEDRRGSGRRAVVRTGRRTRRPRVVLLVAGRHVARRHRGRSSSSASALWNLYRGLTRKFEDKWVGGRSDAAQRWGGYARRRRSRRALRRLRADRHLRDQGGRRLQPEGRGRARRRAAEARASELRPASARPHRRRPRRLRDLLLRRRALPRRLRV